VTSDTSAMPETAGGAAVLSDPKDPASIARAIVEAAGPERDRLRDAGLQRAGQFTWAATGASTLDVYREVAERRRHGQTWGYWSPAAPASSDPTPAIACLRSGTMSSCWTRLIRRFIGASARCMCPPRRISMKETSATESS